MQNISGFGSRAMPQEITRNIVNRLSNPSRASLAATSRHLRDTVVSTSRQNMRVENNANQNNYLEAVKTLFEREENSAEPFQRMLQGMLQSDLQQRRMRAQDDENSRNMLKLCEWANGNVFSNGK